MRWLHAYSTCTLSDIYVYARVQNTTTYSLYKLAFIVWILTKKKMPNRNHYTHAHVLVLPHVNTLSISHGRPFIYMCCRSVLPLPAPCWLEEINPKTANGLRVSSSRLRHPNSSAWSVEGSVRVNSLSELSWRKGVIYCRVSYSILYSVQVHVQ